MTWTVTSREDQGRWLTYSGDGPEATPDMWEADPETRTYLTREGYSFPLTPTGPIATIADDSTLMAAALNLLPSARVSGEHPNYPPVRSAPGVIY
ncbi:hypothetical protein [Rhodococcus sp. 1168]|uniref:hypothetical protein n=1 Tax=Rhodococcus sp. 1168 TaxID=2018041 RepID=UPI000A0EB27F|nr:hypothetical protein [Rhodococcus sp. 1168]ORI15780.1 hypothetical protein BJI47_01415 [Rhodococcus sp. 1168]